MLILLACFPISEILIRNNIHEFITFELNLEISQCKSRIWKKGS